MSGSDIHMSSEDNNEDVFVDLSSDEEDFSLEREEENETEQLRQEALQSRGECLQGFSNSSVT